LPPDPTAATLTFMATPRLRTVIDLTGNELVELESFSPQLTGLMQMAKRDAAHLFKAGELIDHAKADPVLDHTAKILILRLAHHYPDCIVTGGVCGAATALSGGTPGVAVLWAQAFAAYWLRTGKPVTVGSIFLDLFDGCLPTRAGLRTLWEAQKVPYELLQQMRATDIMASDNWVDHPQAWTRECLAPIS
jgi:hypothetical protein